MKSASAATIWSPRTSTRPSRLSFGRYVRDDLAVVVPEHAPARDVASPRLPEQRVVGPLARSVPLHLVGERGHAHDELVGGRVQGTFAVFEVQPDVDPGLRQLLERVGGLDLLAAEPRLFAHDEDLKRRPGLERVHQAQETGAIDKLRAGEPIPVATEGHLNLIHVDDAATAVLTATQVVSFDDGPRVYCISDGHPVQRREYYREVAARLSDRPHLH